MTETQLREQKIYDYFQSKALHDGITTQDFEKYLDKNILGYNGKAYITNPSARFRKIVGEFSAMLTKKQDGKMLRYYLDDSFDGISLYFRHYGLQNILSDALGEAGFEITYQKNNEEFCVTFFPDYKRIYNNKFYIYGVALDKGDNTFDIVEGKSTNVKFTQLDIGLITRIQKSRKKFRKAFLDNDSENWETTFAYILGVDPIPNREVSDMHLYVKNTFRERFMKGVLASFIEGEELPDKEGYALLRLKIKLNKELERVLLSFGGDVIVKSPDKIKTVIAKEIKKLNQYYNG